ncbi:MAG: caspase family protein, partial [Bradyrhizobium sp.]
MRYPTLVLSLICTIFTAGAASAEKRVAFVVGNGTYKNVAALPNPSIDAKAMASALRNVGFEVVEGSNLTRDKMTEKLLDFGKKAQGADVAVFFYAGHGIAIGGTNYLLPIDADIKSEMDVKLGAAINIDLTLDQTMSDAKVKLVLLDACRDNPFAAKIKSNAPSTRSVSVQTGLAEMKSGEGTLIAFATGPGQTALDGKEGSNSPFTRALLANLTQPGVELQQAMTKVRAQVQEETNKGQLPWGNTNLTGAVYLNGAPAPAAPGSAPVAVAVAPGSDVELEFWRSIKD